MQQGRILLTLDELCNNDTVFLTYGSVSLSLSGERTEEQTER